MLVYLSIIAFIWLIGVFVIIVTPAKAGFTVRFGERMRLAIFWPFELMRYLWEG